MALTILEAAKQNPGTVHRDTIIELYARNSALLRVLPMDPIQGNAIRYDREGALPGISFRGVNEAYTESTGVINPITEPLVIAGGDLDVDRFIIQTQGARQRGVQEAMKVKRLAHEFANTFIKGDSQSTPKVFDGLQVRLTGNQLISNSAGTGAALSLLTLDTLIDAVEDPTHLFMNKTMRRRLTQAARNTSVGGFITWSKDEFGRQVAGYNGLPIVEIGGHGELYDTLQFNEAAEGGGTASTSIYCASLRDAMLTGIQNGVPDVRDLGELDTKPVMRTRVEWYVGIAMYHPRAAARLYGVTNAAVVV